jgi:hypothetical protein
MARTVPPLERHVHAVSTGRLGAFDRLRAERGLSLPWPDDPQAGPWCPGRRRLPFHSGWYERPLVRTLTGTAARTAPIHLAGFTTGRALAGQVGVAAFVVPASALLAESVAQDELG